MRIAQASSSETFTKYGTAPNQRRTGVTASKPYGNLDGELNIIEWGKAWECVYRPLDEGVAERIATFMEQAVKNGSHIGYSQDSTRVGVFDACKAMSNPDPLKITTLVNTDCATLVGAAIYFAGIKSDALRKLCTWEMETVLLNTGAFTKLTGKDMVQKGKGIRRGDVLWRDGHTGVALDTDPVEPSNPLFYFQTYRFSATIAAGTPGTRAVQRSLSVAKKGYRPVVARLSYVSNSALANVVPFFGYGDETRLCCNFYRASGSGKVDATVMVVYVKNEAAGG